MAVRRGSAFPVRPAAPIKGLSAGDGARCPPPAPQAIFLSTFSQVSPKRRLAPHPPVCFPPPRGAGGAPRGGGGVKGLLSPGGGSSP